MGKLGYQDSMREQMVGPNPNTTGLKAPGINSGSLSFYCPSQIQEHS